MKRGGYTETDNFDHHPSGTWEPCHIKECGDRIWEEKSPRRWLLHLLDAALSVTILEWLGKPDLVLLIRHFIVRRELC